jgi:hypothetical protein
MPHRKFLRSYPGGNRITIQGQVYPVLAAKTLFYCIHCLGNLKRRNHGLVCSLNSTHYGFIKKTQDAKLSQEERFMNIGQMFPSEYLRGIDVTKPMKLTIKAVVEETAHNRQTNKREQEYVMRFDGLDKKLRLNVTMAKEVAMYLGPETDDWVGKAVTVYRTNIKAFGAEHIVPRLRKPERGDKAFAAKPRFRTIDDLLYQLGEDFGLSESDAKAKLKDCGYNGFTTGKANDMYQAVKDLVMDGVVPEPEPVDNGQMVLETEAA